MVGSTLGKDGENVEMRKNEGERDGKKEERKGVEGGGVQSQVHVLTQSLEGSRADPVGCVVVGCGRGEGGRVVG